jgi:hypothetical protein
MEKEPPAVDAADIVPTLGQRTRVGRVCSRRFSRHVAGGTQFHGEDFVTIKDPVRKSAAMMIACTGRGEIGWPAAGAKFIADGLQSPQKSSVADSVSRSMLKINFKLIRIDYVNTASSTISVHMDELTDFRWSVPEESFCWAKGHRISDATRSEGAFLAMKLTGAKVRLYLPLIDEPALFKRFADTPPNRGGILAFANSYGSLTGGEIIMRADHKWVQGESFQFWKVSIAEMRTMVLLWEAAKAGNVEHLSKHIEWVPGSVLFRGHNSSSTIADERMNPEVLARFRQGDLAVPAMYHLQREVNGRLANRGAVPKLLWNKQNDLVIRISATSLIGALWLQFAKAIEGDREFRQCENESCRKWIEVGGSRGARSDKRFCTPTCKSRAHQRKSYLRV